MQTIESAKDLSRITKNAKISETMTATRRKRMEQQCRVFEIKVIKGKLSSEKREHLHRLFLEGKWLWNHTLAQEDVFRANRCPKSVNVITHLGNIEERTLYVLGSQMKQDIVDSVKTAIKGLATIKKNGEKVGRIRFRKFCNSIPLRQYGITYRIDFENNTISIQELTKPIKVRGLSQIPEGVDIANARLVRKPSGLYFHITTYSEKETREYTGLIGALDFGIRKNFTFNDGRSIDITVSESRKLKSDQRKMNRLYSKNGKTSNHNKRVKQICRDYEKINNRKTALTNQFVHEILETYDLFAIQDDSISAWQMRRFIKRSVQYSAMGRVKAKLKASPRTIVVPYSFPSTQRCPICGRDTKHPVYKHDYNCAYCGYHHASRDQKSANMILMEALKQNVCVERTAKSPAQAMASIGADTAVSVDCKLLPIDWNFDNQENRKPEAFVSGSSRNRRSIFLA